MTEFAIRESGLAVPKEKPKQVAKRRPALQIQDESCREKASDALADLWDALGLSNEPGGIRLPGHDEATYAAHYKAYRYIGEMLLGDDCPEKAILT